MEPLVYLPSDSSPVTDADEEIFLLYSALNQTKTNLVGPDGYRGLGHLDSRRDTLTIQFELRPPSSAPSPPHPTKRPKHSRKKASSKGSSTRVIEIEIAQDSTALRSRNGDTGSVVWRASTELAKAVLQQHFFPPELPVFNRERLAESHCLELGAGTGVLGLALSPLLRTYTITDIRPLLPLIRKNISLHSPGWHDGSLGILKSNVTIEELDWLALASLPSGAARARYCPVPKVTSASELESTNHAAWDVVFAVDCIYNPSLLPALLDVIDTVSTAGRTWVFVVAELRQEDVLREFLDLWLKTASGRWEIARVEGLLDMHFVAWAGWKRPD
ncbi:hypothetical protein J3R82DRAFT_8441 [Butyriboletus roseoflavus]|nr:hypothetical protein J3R82DRAFT_8441 [Butyriboletus roseoflavus]